MTYSDLLKDPRWQKKRLEIFNRDNFSCVSCGDGASTLHVHHHYYINGKKPWEYNNSVLVTLCEQCHGNEEHLKECDSDVINVLLSSGLLRYDLQCLIQLVHQKSIRENPSYFRKVFHRILEKFRVNRFKRKPKKSIRLTELLKFNNNG